MTNEELREAIDELLDVGNLTRWESNFLVSVGSTLDQGRHLSDSQTETLQALIEDKL